MRNRKIDLQLGVSFFCAWFVLQYFVIILEYTCGGDDVEGDTENLNRCKWCIACGGELNCIFDLLEENFNQEVDILCCLHSLIIFLEIRRSVFCI